jgi:hypothetical protein
MLLSGAVGTGGITRVVLRALISVKVSFSQIQISCHSVGITCLGGWLALFALVVGLCAM